jgi:hypothetical protein
MGQFECPLWVGRGRSVSGDLNGTDTGGGPPLLHDSRIVELELVLAAIYQVPFSFRDMSMFGEGHLFSDERQPIVSENQEWRNPAIWLLQPRKSGSVLSVRAVP